jgi:hypothetical protein
MREARHGGQSWDLSPGSAWVAEATALKNRSPPGGRRIPKVADRLPGCRGCSRGVLAMAFTGKAAEAAQGTSQVHQTSVTAGVRGRGAVKVAVTVEPGKEPVAECLGFGNGNAKPASSGSTTAGISGRKTILSPGWRSPGGGPTRASTPTPKA